MVPLIILLVTGLILVVAFAYSQTCPSQLYLAIVIALCAIIVIAYFHTPDKKQKLMDLISLPAKYYVIPGVVGLGTIGFYCLMDNGKLATIIISLGTGVIASIIVSILIDMGNTKRKKQADRALFAFLNEDIEQRLNKLIELSCLASTSLDCEMRKECHSFIEWTTILFGSKTIDEPARKIAQMPYLDELDGLCSALERIQISAVLNENQYFCAGFKAGIAEVMQTIAEMRSALRADQASDHLIYEKCRRFCACICSFYSGYDKRFKEEISFSTCNNYRLKDDFGIR